MADSKTGQEIQKMSLEHLTVPKSKEVLQEKCNDGGMSKGHRSQPKELSIAKMEQFEQEDNQSTIRV